MADKLDKRKTKIHKGETSTKGQRVTSKCKVAKFKDSNAKLPGSVID